VMNQDFQSPGVSELNYITKVVSSMSLNQDNKTGNIDGGARHTLSMSRHAV
jgi:hypothetical protein